MFLSLKRSRRFGVTIVDEAHDMSECKRFSKGDFYEEPCIYFDLGKAEEGQVFLLLKTKKKRDKYYEDLIIKLNKEIDDR